jgi:hypothetical protein
MRVCRGLGVCCVRVCSRIASAARTANTKQGLMLWRPSWAAGNMPYTMYSGSARNGILDRRLSSFVPLTLPCRMPVFVNASSQP